MADTITIEERSTLGIATVMARKGVTAETLAGLLGVSPPCAPATASANGLTLLGAGPGSWLAMQDNADDLFAHRLRESLSGHASVSDQSSSYAVLRLSGPGARTVLQRGAAIDVHPDSFRPGSAATTVIAHIGVIVWQVDDRPTYDLAVFRSLSNSFRHWLEQATAAL